MENPATDKPMRIRRFPVTAAVIWAMGCQTLRQCLRRKVLLVLVLFVGWLLISTRIIPSHDPVGRLEVVTQRCLGSAFFFGIIVAVFLAATILPDDRRTKTIVTLMTKPVGKLNYLLGRVLGFAMTLGIILGVMGFVSWGLIRWEGAAAERRTGRTDLLTAKRGIDPTEVYLRDGEKTSVMPDWAASGALTGAIRQQLVYCFRTDLDRLVPGEQRVEMAPRVASGLMPRADAEFTVENPATKERRKYSIVLDDRRPASVTFPGTLVDATQGVNVTVQRLSPGTFVAFPRGTFLIMIAPVPFEYALLKALAMTFCGFLLVIVISVAASTFLSAWVATVLAFASCFFAAIQKTLLDFMQTLQGKNIGLLGSQTFQHSHGPLPTPPPDTWFVILTNNLYYGVIWGLTHVFPSFDRFSASSFLASSHDVPASVLVSAFGVFLCYGTCYLVIAHVIFWRREVAP